MGGPEDKRVSVLVRSVNSFDFTDAELEAIAADLATECARSQDPDVTATEIGYAQRDSQGSGATWWDILEVFVQTADQVKDELLSMIVGVAVEHMRERLRKEPERPRRVRVLYAEDGSVLKEVDLKDDSGR